MSDKMQLDRIEDLLTQLISNVASTRSDLADFRTEVNQRLESIEAHQALADKRLKVQRDDISDIRERVGILEQGKQ